MEDVQVFLLDSREIQKNDKVYYIIKVFCSLSDVAFTVFVSQEIYNDINTGVINNSNIINYCHFKVDSNRVFSISIY